LREGSSLSLRLYSSLFSLRCLPTIPEQIKAIVLDIRMGSHELLWGFIPRSSSNVTRITLASFCWYKVSFSSQMLLLSFYIILKPSTTFCFLYTFFIIPFVPIYFLSMPLFLLRKCGGSGSLVKRNQTTTLYSLLISLLSFLQ